jgi:enamine deaminase RidA (YjgF/YER057c/UK114 family)
MVSSNRETVAIKHLDPPEIHANPAYSQGVCVPAGARYIHVGGQNGVDAEGRIVGQGDLAVQTARALANLSAVLGAGGARPDDLISLSIYLVGAADLRPAVRAWASFWGDRGPPPAVKMLRVLGLANPDFLIEIEGVAAVIGDDAR